MQKPELRSDILKLIDRMVGPPPSHPRFAGEPIDMTQIDALALGDLWSVAYATKRWDEHRRVEGLAADTARAVLDRRHDIEPVFRGPACRDVLDVLSREVEANPIDAADFRAVYPWQEACFALERCIDLSFAGLGAAARRFLAAADWRAMPHLALVLTRLVDTCFETQALEKLAVVIAASPLLVAELRAVTGLDLLAMVKVAGFIARDGGEIAWTPHHPLAEYPIYAAFAETGLKQAAERVRAIHDRAMPYASDKAFTLDESAVVARLARVGLDRDEPWLAPVLDELFRKVSLAPSAAKSVPSQSVAISVGHAVEAYPTPESVATLRGVLRDIRHAGVKKKLQRNLRGAERRLAERPEIALRLPLDQPISKSQLTTLTRCLEASLAVGLALDYGDWRTRLTTLPQVKNLTGSLVWRLCDAGGNHATVLPMMVSGRLSLQTVSGAEVVPTPGSRMTLWHPADSSSAERRAWRDHVAARHIRQPFKQVFREHYIVPPDALTTSSTAMFCGHIVSIIPLLGLARRERWRVDYDGLTRSFGPWTARLDLADHVYPGCVGATTTRELTLWTSGDKTPVPAQLGDLSKATLSEILRAVDLLVSTSGFAVTADDPERHRDSRVLHLAENALGAMAAMRKQALARALHGLVGMERLAFDARHLRLGPYAVHLATGRITCDGEPVTIDPPINAKLVAVPWLPYDERLLETIAHAAIEIAQRLKR
jgi:hypothetical protein